MSCGEQWIIEHQPLLASVNDAIWSFAETGLLETRSSAYLTGLLRDNGFEVTEGVAGMPTAFVASCGEGNPAIGLLAEYDALPGLGFSKSALPEGDETGKLPGEPGHGCGHNALAAAIIGGALGLKAAIEGGECGGRVVVYGCPAEELLVGKVKIAREKLFSSCDCLFSCHPNDVSYVWARTSNAVWSAKFNFHGVTAHAAIDPYNGRSALDAVELMDMGANYLREHVTPDVRLHYVVTDGGEVPNVVPAKAQVWYTVRAKNTESLSEVTDRVICLAQGASIMTGTGYDVEPVSGCADVLRNRELERLLLKQMKAVGAPEWSDEDETQAKSLSRSLPDRMKKSAIESFHLTEAEYEKGLHTGVYDGFYQEGQVMAVSTDVGDASWQVPTGVFSFAATVLGAPGHSWYYTAGCGSSLAHKGVVMAARVLCKASLELMTDPDALARVKEAYAREKGDREYRNFFDRQERGR